MLVPDLLYKHMAVGFEESGKEERGKKGEKEERELVLVSVSVQLIG